jgi:hypothetical protein
VAHRILRDPDFDTGIEGWGYFVQYSTKNNQKKTSSSFQTLQQAIEFGKAKQHGNEVVNVMDGTNTIMIEKAGGINLSGKWSEGV